MLPNVYDQAKFNPDDLLAILQGITGFVGAIKGKDPLDFIDTALGLAGSQSGKQCLGSLESNLGSIKKWLTFGKVYTPLVDSSDLDFDKLDVASVPEIMQVRNLFVILIRNAMSPPFYAIVYTCKGSNQRQRNQFLCSSFFFSEKKFFLHAASNRQQRQLILYPFFVNGCFTHR